MKRRVGMEDYLVFLQTLVSGRRLATEHEAARIRKDMTAPYLDYYQPLSVLDIGSGALLPQVQILESDGHLAIGLDLGHCSTASGFESLGYRFARWLFRRGLGTSKTTKGAAARICGDAARIPLRSRSIDLVTSIAAFEHFLDVPGVVRELARVLRHGGVVFTIVHPFTALSGGHNLQLMDLPITNLPKGVAAWDHLRERRIPITVPLNEWRIADYLAAFSVEFEIVDHGCWMEEGRNILTNEIADELAEYSKDELLTGTYYVVALKL